MILKEYAFKTKHLHFMKQAMSSLEYGLYGKLIYDHLVILSRDNVLNFFYSQ
jgi:hypothetical protein